MFRSQYDNDITVWSPQGRLHQVEYAMEAVKQGSAVIGLKSKYFVVICALKRTSSELSEHQKKIFTVDKHMGIGIAGLTADARVLSKFMRQECLNHRFVYDAPMPVARIVNLIGDRSQVTTQRYGKRPFGVGLLVAGYDQTGTHLYQTDPSGNYFDYIAMSIGARAQSAKTYLEKYYKTFENLSLPELIRQGILALRETSQKSELTSKNISVAIVGENRNFEIIENAALQPYLEGLEEALATLPTTTSADVAEKEAMET